MTQQKLDLLKRYYLAKIEDGSDAEAVLQADSFLTSKVTAGLLTEEEKVFVTERTPI